MVSYFVLFGYGVSRNWLVLSWLSSLVGAGDEFCLFFFSMWCVGDVVVVVVVGSAGFLCLSVMC